MDFVNDGQIRWWDKIVNPSTSGRKQAKETKSWSSYWLDEDSYNRVSKFNRKFAHRVDGANDVGYGEVDLQEVHRFAQIRRSISNFVYILTGRPDIRVVFSGGEKSFTDGNIVVISADNNPQNFDRIVGTALHEAAHCAFSNGLFEKTKATKDSVSSKRRMMVQHGVSLDLIEDLLGVDLFIEDQWKIFYRLINVLEDRRIDNEVYNRAPGYRPYYNQMYQHYWNNSEIAKRLIRDPFLNVPTFDSYDNRIINITNPATKYTLDRLPGFRQIVEIVNLPDILRFSNPDGSVKADDMFDTVAEIFTIVAENAVENKYDTLDFGFGFEYEKEGDGFDDSSLPNYDDAALGGGEEEEDTEGEADDGSEGEEEKEEDLDEIEEKVAKELGTDELDEYDGDELDELMDKFINNEMPKEEMPKDMRDLVTVMEDSETSIDTIKCNGIEYPFVRVPKINKTIYDNLIPHQMKPKFDTGNDSFISAGRRLGQTIVNKIKIRHDKNDIKYTRRERGKIDPRLIHSLGYSNENVFYEKVTESYKDTVIYLTIDASGSVEYYWDQIRSMAIGFGYAAKKIHNFDVVINLRYGLVSIWSVTLFDSRVNTEKDLYRHMSWFVPTGTTPESLVYEIEESYLEEMNTVDNNVYFVTLTDGLPNYTTDGRYQYDADFGSQTAIKHCRMMMRKFSERGIKQLAYFITDRSSSDMGDTHRGIPVFKKSYRENASIVPMENFSQITSRLNKLLTQLG